MDILKKSSHYKRLVEIYETQEVEIFEKIERYKENPKEMIKLGSFFNFLSSDYKSLGICELVINQDYKKSKQWFYMSAEVEKIYLKKFDEKNPEENIHAGGMNMLVYHELLNSLISDNDEQISQFAKLMGGRGELDGACILKFDYHVGYSLKYLVFDDYENAKLHVNGVIAQGNLKKNILFQGYGIVLKGILDNDEHMTNEGLAEILKKHKKLYKKYGTILDEFISIPATGMAKLAMRKGIRITVKSPYLPVGMLERQDINYPVVDFI